MEETTKRELCKRQDDGSAHGAGRYKCLRCEYMFCGQCTKKVTGGRMCQWCIEEWQES